MFGQDVAVSRHVWNLGYDFVGKRVKEFHHFGNTGCAICKFSLPGRPRVCPNALKLNKPSDIYKNEPVLEGSMIRLPGTTI